MWSEEAVWNAIWQLVLILKKYSTHPYPNPYNTNKTATHPPTPWSLYNMWTAPLAIQVRRGTKYIVNRQTTIALTSRIPIQNVQI